jgi:RNA polymerase sigma-70 factor, ECF subfamily
MVPDFCQRARLPSLAGVDLVAAAARAAAGDTGAADLWVRATYPDVWRFVCSMVGADRAADVVQDTYLRAWRALPTRPSIRDPKAWLLTIAWRACTDQQRRDYRYRRKVLRLAAQRPWPAVPAADESVTKLLLTNLPLERRAAFALTQLLGYTYAETAEICATEIGTIRSRVARARQDLAAALNPTADNQKRRPNP